MVAKVNRRLVHNCSFYTKDAEWYDECVSISFKSMLVKKGSATSQHPIAYSVIQNVRLCVMIFPYSWLAEFSHVTLHISPDNTLRHRGWSHSPDLAAPANWREMRKNIFQLICYIYWKRFTPCTPPTDFEPFVLVTPLRASQGLLISCTQCFQMQLAFSQIWTWRKVKSPQDVTDSSALFVTVLSRCHICVVLKH